MIRSDVLGHRRDWRRLWYLRRYGRQVHAIASSADGRCSHSINAGSSQSSDADALCWILGEAPRLLAEAGWSIHGDDGFDDDGDDNDGG